MVVSLFLTYTPKTTYKEMQHYPRDTFPGVTVWGQGAGGREQGAGNRGQGAGSREQVFVELVTFTC